MAQILGMNPYVCQYLAIIEKMIGRDGFDDITINDLTARSVVMAKNINAIPEPVKSWGKRAMGVLKIIEKGDGVLPYKTSDLTVDSLSTKELLYPESYKNMFNTTYYRDVVGGKRGKI